MDAISLKKLKQREKDEIIKEYAFKMHDYQRMITKRYDLGKLEIQKAMNMQCKLEEWYWTLVSKLNGYW